MKHYIYIMYKSINLFIWSTPLMRCVREGSREMDGLLHAEMKAH